MRSSSRCLILLFLLLGSLHCVGQQIDASDSAELKQMLRAMQLQIQKLQEDVTELKAETQRYRVENEQLRADAIEHRDNGDRSPEGEPTPYSTTTASSAQDAATATLPPEDALKLLEAKVNDQFQTKVESGSRYRVKLSGMVLLNTFENRGTVDNIDIPGIAEPQAPVFGRGAFGATLRQSQIGIDVIGPVLAGARVSGNLRFDFAGGFPDLENGVSMGLLRLRTGGVRLDWKSTSVVAGQEAPFFSPLSPTSLASQAQPEFWYSGNLWTWMPQISVEKRFAITERNTLGIQGGILDPMTGEPPVAQSERLPQAGEVSRQPAYAMRLLWRRGESDEQSEAGLGGYYSRQDWGFGRTVDGYAVTADWKFALPHRFEFSGEFFRGRGIGGLGGATNHSVLTTGALVNSQAVVRGLDVMGGWTQLKYRATPKLQFNVAVGQDNPFSTELRQFQMTQNLLDPELGKTQSAMFNFIYKVKSNVLFSTEYRHINSVRLNQDRLSAEHVNLSIGVLF